MSNVQQEIIFRVDRLQVDLDKDIRVVNDLVSRLIGNVGGEQIKETRTKLIEAQLWLGLLKKEISEPSES